jgi:enamine deaminase RidA (YjgF/YER057c/UK114 family)
MFDAEQRLSARGLKLPGAPKPVASYVPFIISGDQLFISGQISTDDAGRVLTGVLGAGMSIEQGQAAARHAALYVASSAGFQDQPKVINGASDFLVAVLADAGRHTRSAVGVASLPLGACVEIDAILKIR